MSATLDDGTDAANSPDSPDRARPGDQLSEAASQGSGRRGRWARTAGAASAAAEVLRPHIGWAFVGTGGLLVLLGWVGVSGEASVARQLPYLASGGVGGIVLAIVGAYFLGTDQLRADSGRLDRLERQVAELHAALLVDPDRPAPDRAGTAPVAAGPPGAEMGDAESSAAGDRAVVVASTGTVHRSSCRLTEDRPTRTVTPRDLAEATTCAVCEPRLA